MKMNRRGMTGKIAAAFVLAGALMAPAAYADNDSGGGRNVLFVQQDKVTAFNPLTGAGQQVGTVTGRITGTSIVNFQFIPTSLTTINFDNNVVLTDLDGDQIRFRNRGSGKFVLPIDPTAFAIGGPLVGNYEVIAGTGKYSNWVGRKFPYRAVASNPPDNLGSVYVEVYSNSR
ncbi:MAG: hypothetical protein ABL967_11005 [Bryobacteraceae bacterium]